MVMHLQGRRVVRAEEMAAHFEVAVRTVYRDIAALAEAGVPICGEAGVGYSLMKGYHLPPVMLTAEEAMALFVGGEMVKQFADASMRTPMASALTKIRSVLPRESQDDLERLSEATAIFGESRLPSGLDQRMLLPIQQAIVARRVLRMTYRARARDEETVREVEPLGVTYHSAAWYLVAWCRLRSDFRYFKIERLRALEVLKERFASRTDFSLREHLRALRATGERCVVRVWFSPDAIERVRRESHTEIQTEQGTGGGFEVTMETFSLEWLARWLMSFGTEAEALEPVSLRELVQSEAKALLWRYGSKGQGGAKMLKQKKRSIAVS
jgi:predicted DNA-binding transcriptional regulator YafY